MREFNRRTMRRLGALTGATLLGAGAAFQLLAAQERQVVSNQIAVSNSEATLSLEFTDRGSLEIAFRDGVVEVDGRELGSYDRGGRLEGSWRALLGRAVALDDGPLSDALTAWEPSDDLGPEALAVAVELDRVLENALAAPAAPESPDGTAVAGTAQTLEQVRELLERTDRLSGLAEAIEGVELDGLTLYVGEDVTVPASTAIDGTLVVVDGDLALYGSVDADVVVVGGSIRLYEGASVGGDVRLTDARLFRDGGVVEGRVRNFRADRDDLERRVRDEIRNEVRRDRGADRSGGFQPLRHIARGMGGLVQTAITLGIVMIFGLGVVYFGRERLEIVSEAARAYPGRSALVGVAGGFLFFPVWVLGTIALAVSIIGIPVLLVWVPLFPLAGVLAAGLGYLAVAVNLGEWLERRDVQALDWIRASNPLYTMLAGVAALMAPFALGHVAEMGGPLLGFLQAMLALVGSIACLGAFAVGFGAVLLTRAGRRREYEAAMMDFDLGHRPWTRRRSSATVVNVEVEAEGDHVSDPVDAAAPERDTAPDGSGRDATSRHAPEEDERA